jgi:hypothetical protein
MRALTAINAEVRVVGVDIGSIGRGIEWRGRWALIEERGGPVVELIGEKLRGG